MPLHLCGYSVLMRVSDVANNSRIARRFFLYDDTSAITLNDEKPLFVSSAVAETGYAWQMPSRSNGKHYVHILFCKKTTIADVNIIMNTHAHFIFQTTK